MNIREVLKHFSIDENVATRILNALNSEKRLVMIRAPAGSGKTTIVLCRAVELAQQGVRTGVFFRTISQVDYALGLIRRILRISNVSVKVVPVVGKVRLCLNPPPDSDPFPKWCDYSKCPLRSRGKRVKEFPSVPESLEQLMNIGRSNGVCPYYLSLSEAEKADIVIATQAFFINDKLMEMLGKLDIAVVDEAHGLMHLITEISEEEYRRGRELSSMRLEDMSIEDAGILSRYEDYVDTDGDEVVLRGEGKRLKVVPPIRLIRKRLESVKKIILVSATIYPTGLFGLLFARGIDAEIEVIPGLIRETEKRKILGVVVEDLSSKRELRTPRQYDRYAYVIRKLIERIGKPALILAPSYEFAQELSKRLGFPVCRDPREAKGDVVIGVLRGRFSEGIEVDLGAPLRLLVIAGLPYRPRSPEFLSMVKVYAREYGVDFYELARAIEESDMINALIQALGRVGRRERGVAVILDSRVRKKNLGVRLVFV